MKTRLVYEVFGETMHRTSAAYITQWAQQMVENEDTSKEVRNGTRLVFSDAADLYAIGTLLLKGQVNHARNLAISLDTIIRDEIPQDVWDFLHGRKKND